MRFVFYAIAAFILILAAVDHLFNHGIYTRDVLWYFGL